MRDFKTVRVKIDTWKRLQAEKLRNDETLDEIIRKMIKESERKSKKKQDLYGMLGI